MYQSSVPANDVDVAALWHAIWGRKLLIVCVVFLVGFLTFSGLKTVTPEYTSEARILIENDESAFTRPTSSQPIAVPMDPEAIASQVEVLLSRDLALEVVKALELAKTPEFNPALRKITPFKGIMAKFGMADAEPPENNIETVLDAFAEQTSVYQIRKSRVIAVRVSSSDRHLSAKVANRLAESYLSWQQRERMGQTKDASIWLREQISMLRKRVEESEAAVAKFRGKTGLVAGQNDITLSAQELSELNSQLILARAQRSEVEARAKLIKKMLREKGGVDASPDVLKSELIRRLLEQRVTLQRTLAETSATLLPSHPRIRRLRSELTDLRAQIRKEIRKIVKSLESEAQIAGAREASLRASLNQLKSDKTALSEDEIKLRGLEREAKVNRDMLESYLTRYSDANARHDILAVPAYASIISKAGPANAPSFPKTKQLTALAMAAAAFLLIAFYLTKELIVGQFSSRSRPAPAPVIRNDLQEPPMAAPPERERVFAPPVAPSPPPMTSPPPEPMATPVPSTAPPEAGRGEEILKLQALMKRLGAQNVGRTMIVPERRALDVAADALQLTRGLAGAGHRAVLVDLTEASSGVAELLNLENRRGLGELLGGIATFEDVIHKDLKSTAHIIPRGNPHLNPAHKAEDPAFGQILMALDQTYDRVLLHSNGSAAQNLLLRYGQDFAQIVIVGDKPLEKKARWGALDRQIDQLGLGHKVIRFVRGGSSASLLSRLPGIGSRRTAAA